MTRQEFINTYKAMVRVEAIKAGHGDDFKDHDIRCYSFWLADGLESMSSRKDTAYMIRTGAFPTCRDVKELEDHLTDEYEAHGDHTEILQALRNHIADYFGN